MHGNGIDLIEDKRKLSMADAKKIVNHIMLQYDLAELDLKNKKMVRFFVAKFFEKGVKISQIEKILNVSRYKIEVIL